jgi:membrane protease YdiL (CAAX protease family)
MALPRFAQALAIALMGLGLGGLVAGSGIQAARPELALPLAGLGAALTMTALAWAGVVALGSERPWHQLGLGPGRLRAPGLALVVMGVLVMSLGVDAALRVMELRDTGSLARLDRAVSAVRAGPSLWVVFATLSLAPALGEELLFRGFLQRCLVERMRPALAIGISAAAFGALHWDPVHAVAAFALGLYLGSVVHLAGSIRAAILCHAANNCWAVAVIVLGLRGIQLPIAVLPLLFVAAALLLRLAAGFRTEPAGVHPEPAPAVPEDSPRGK